MSAAILVALVLAGGGAAVLLAGLLITAALLRRISGRLVSLLAVLGSIGDATDPLAERVTGIRGNVRNLREAAADLNQVLADRVGS
jgi:hypothetical protein